MTENNFQIDSAAVSDRGLSKKRPQNEDSFLELNERGLFVVADGVGGAQAGDVASKMAVEVLSEAFTNFQKNIDAEETMKSAIERANKVIFQKAHDSPQFSTMATTIVALHIAGNIATIGHVAEELGLFGGLLVILALLVFVSAGVRTAMDARDMFSKLCAAGLTAFIGFQALVNMGGITRALPMTGITLPFISHGGFSLITSFIMLGMLLAFSHRNTIDTQIESGV